jgi:hypothetical protein
MSICPWNGKAKSREPVALSVGVESLATGAIRPAYGQHGMQRACHRGPLICSLLWQPQIGSKDGSAAPLAGGRRRRGGAGSGPPSQDDINKALRMQSKLREKNRKAQQRFRERQRVSGGQTDRQPHEQLG